MSSLARRIQKKGSQMGVPSNKEAKDLIARLAREEKK